MINSTNLNQIDGGTQIKQGDTSSQFSYQLLDERGQLIDLQGEATVKLICGGKAWQKQVSIKESAVRFTLDILPISTYELEISADGYIFPSDHSVKIHVTKSEHTYYKSDIVELKKLDIAEEVKKYVDALGLKGVSDDRIVELIKASVGKPLDVETIKQTVLDMHLTDDVSNKFNKLVEEVHAKLDREQVNELIEQAIQALPKSETFDPSEIQDELNSIKLSKIDAQTAQELIREALEGIPKEDITPQLKELTSQITAISDKVTNLETSFRNDIEELKARPAGQDVDLSEYAKKSEIPQEANLSPIEERLATLEAKPDKDTIYDDSALTSRIDGISERVQKLEDKPADEVDLSAYALKSELPNTEDLVSRQSLDSDLSLKADKAELDQYAKKSELPQGVDLGPLEGRVATLEGRVDKDTVFDDTELRSEINGVSERVTNLENKPAQEVDLSNYATKEELPSLDGYALKTDIPTVSNLATKEELAGKADKSQLPDFSLYALKSEIPSDSRGGGTATSQPVQDTGWRKMTSANLTDGYIAIRRIGSNCYLTVGGGMWGTFSTKKDGSFANVGAASTVDKLQLTGNNQLPSGFKTPFSTSSAVFRDNGEFFGMCMLASISDNSVLGIRSPKHFTKDYDTRYLRMPIISYVTTDDFPSEDSIKQYPKI